MINTNDLIGLKRAWGAYPNDGSGTVDCCLLAAEVHKRLGYWDYTDELRTYFRTFTDDTLPKSFIARWLVQHAERLTAPEPHAVVLLPSDETGAVGTVLDDGRILCITKGSGVALTQLAPNVGWYFRLHR